MGRRRKAHIEEQVLIVDVAEKGKSIGKTDDGRVFFVEGCVPGDLVDVLVTKKKKSFFIGKAVHFHEYSKDRVEPFCTHFGACGGCKWQHIAYEAQLKHKQSIVENSLIRIGKVEPEKIYPILGAPDTTFYRNKLEFSASNKRWLSTAELSDERISNYEDVLGFHAPGTFDKVVDVEKCYLQPEPSNEVRNKVREMLKARELPFYDIRGKEGFLRNFMVRLTSLGEMMLVFSFGENDEATILSFLDEVMEAFPKTTSLHYCINMKMNDTILDLDIITYKGKGYVEEVLGDIRYKIGPKSFFQTNSRQGKNLYDIVVDFAELKGEENVYDLYTGTGSIALYLAKHCKQVVGIEEIADAIKDANFNAEMNSIDNAVFYAGDVKDILGEDFRQKHGKPDLVITDPPRAGMHPKAIALLLKLEAPRIVYVSCKPSTQARDIELLSEKYKVLKVQPVDMFPHTFHIENVALLELK